MIPGDGNDSSEGGAGDDQINGYLQADGSWVHWSSSGRQQASGGDGNDFIYGGSSDDLLEGDAGNDFLVGADGHDVLRGGPGNDTLRGQAGDDTLDGGDGRDYLSGGDGNDTYYVRNNHQSIYDSAGTDTVYLLADFVKVPSNIETVEVAEGVMRLPYWIDALLSDTTAGSRVLDLLGPDKTYAYAFPSALPAYDTKSKDANGWTAFNTTQQQRAQSALSYIASVVDLQFVQTPQANALNTLSFSNNTQSNTTGYAMGPSDLPGGSDLFFDNSSATPNNATFADATHASLTLMHEIGHALGLKHPFSAPDANGNVEDPPYLTGSENATAWSVMSYSSNSDQYHLQYSPLDIAALQYLYGPSRTARTGDDTYRVSETEPNFIWDGAGSDTLTAADCSKSCTLDLRPGYWGFVGTAKADQITAPGQITVNFGSTIESLVGSPFGDHLHGNEVDNRIEGGAGDDSLEGGAGIDTAVYRSAFALASIRKTSTGYVVSTPADGTDTLADMEYAQFADQTLALATLDSSTTAVPVSTNPVTPIPTPAPEPAPTLPTAPPPASEPITPTSPTTTPPASPPSPTVAVPATPASGTGVLPPVGSTLVTLTPMVQVSADLTLLRPGDVATLVFCVSAASASLSASDIVVSGGVLSDFSVSGGTYKVVITPFAGSSAPLVVGVSSSSSVEGSGTSPSSTANTLSISRAPLHPVSGTPSADRLLESPADDAVVGGEGVDTLVLSGPKADYKITYQRVSYNPELSGGFVQDTVSGRDGRDSFVGIEKLQFSDGTFDLLNPPPTEPAVYGQARSMLFDPAYYLLAQPALNKTVTVDSAFSHYLASGAALGYKPNAWFDAAYYENRWPDLQAAHLDNATLFLHYNLYGVWEGRSAGGSFDQFDGQRYLQQWPDVAAYVDANLPAFLGSRSNGAIAHYMIYGSGEGRQAYTQAGTVVSTEVVIEPGLVGVAQ